MELYPCKKQSHREHQMGGEYNQEVSHCILSDGSQKRWNPKPSRPRCSREINDKCERKGIWWMRSSVNTTRPRFEMKVISTHHRRGR